MQNASTANLSIHDLMDHALLKYSAMHDERLDFDLYESFRLTPHNNYRGKAVFKALFDGIEIGKLSVIMLASGDGTGRNEKGDFHQMYVPKSLEYGSNKDRVCPREKSDVVCEGVFPLFSQIKGSRVLFAASLDELILTESSSNVKKITYAWKLGQEEKDFNKVLETGENQEPVVHYTVGSTPWGARFGDPHAIHNSVKDVNVIQIVGFLPIKNYRTPFLELASKIWKYPQGYEGSPSY